MENIQYLLTHFSIKEFLNTWSVTRAAGITAFIGFGLSTISGMLSHWKTLSNGARANWQVLHQWVGWYAWLFLILHIVAIMLDTYVEYSISEVLIPFWSDEKPLENALGIIAAYLFFAVIITTDFIRTQFPRIWRGIHQSAFPAFVLMLAHALMIGTDRDRLPVIILYSIITLLFISLAWMRSKPTPQSIDNPKTKSNQFPS